LRRSASVFAIRLKVARRNFHPPRQPDHRLLIFRARTLAPESLPAALVASNGSFRLATMALQYVDPVAASRGAWECVVSAAPGRLRAAAPHNHFVSACPDF